MKKVLLESIVHFQSIEDFNEATELNYEDLSDHELLKVLKEWHYPGEHDQNWYNYDDLNTSFLGHRYNNHYVLSRYESGLVIGLSYIIEIKDD